MFLWFYLFLLANPASSVSLQEGLSNIYYNLRYLAPGLLDFLIKDFEYSRGELPDTNVNNNAEFDFIVVGAGSAGAIVAARLSEVNVSVLLIEAGGPESRILDIPITGVFSDALSVDWNFRTHPSDKYCRGIREKRCAFFRGRIMGGSTTVGLGLAMRGGPADYDAWESMGNPGWGYKDVVKYFMKMERIVKTKNVDKNFDLEVRGTEGPISVQYTNYHSEISEAFVQAGIESGFEEIDHNGRKHIGFSILQSNVEEGEKVSSNRAYLRPAKNRKNLVLSRNSLVTKVLIDKKSLRATGVTYIKNGKVHTARAKKEVILSAGAIQSPQLMMVSGLGPADQLKKAKVDLVKDVPGVGQNLIDHVILFNNNFLINATGKTFRPIDLLKPWQNRSIAEYFHERKGLLAGSSIAHAVGYVNIDNLDARDGLSNVEFTYIDSALTFDDDLSWRFLGLDSEIYKKTFKPYRNRFAFTIVPVLTKPKSRGYLRIKSSDIRDKPIIVPNYFEHEDDAKAMLKAIRFSIRLSKTRALQKYNATLIQTPVWGCQNLTFMSDEYWKCVMEILTFSYWHYGGTAVMGPKSDPKSVVDERLKVHDIKGLRVVDASIIPLMPSAHNNFPTLMIGEKASDMIKEDWGYSSPTTGSPKPLESTNLVTNATS